VSAAGVVPAFDPLEDRLLGAGFIHYPVQDGTG
jgi:hypothetical protein